MIISKRGFLSSIPSSCSFKKPFSSSFLVHVPHNASFPPPRILGRIGFISSLHRIHSISYHIYVLPDISFLLHLRSSLYHLIIMIRIIARFRKVTMRNAKDNAKKESFIFLLTCSPLGSLDTYL